MNIKNLFSFTFLALFLLGTSDIASADTPGKNYKISRSKYEKQLHGFWLGQSIANWTGLSTEMVRVSPPFFTDNDWGKVIEPAVWGTFAAHTGVIDFYLPSSDQVWGSDDDTDIEYLYQFLLERNKAIFLTPETIRDGWLHHIYSESEAPLSRNNFVKENYLWVSNQRAYQLMEKGLVPPETSIPKNNSDSLMIDAQLTTEIFGLFAPGRPDIALEMAHLPVRVSAIGIAEQIAKFYVVMHSYAAIVPNKLSLKEQTRWLAEKARNALPNASSAAKIFDFVHQFHANSSDGDNWEEARDAVYERYQKQTNDGYEYQGGFDAGINFAASLVSLFYGEGDIRRTIQIGTLAGWDSDNPTATWGGLLGFLLGVKGVDLAFQRKDLPEAYWISRTRRNFPDRTPNSDGEDKFSFMAKRALPIVDRVVQYTRGKYDDDFWYIERGRSEPSIKFLQYPEAN